MIEVKALILFTLVSTSCCNIQDIAKQEILDSIIDYIKNPSEGLKQEIFTMILNYIELNKINSISVSELLHNKSLQYTLEKYDWDHNGRIVPDDLKSAVLDYLKDNITLTELAVVKICLEKYDGFIYKMYDDPTAPQRLNTFACPKWIEVVVNGKVVQRWELAGVYHFQGRPYARYKLIGEEYPPISPNDEVVIRGYYAFMDGSPAPYVTVETWFTWFMGWIKHADGPIVHADENGYFEIKVPKFYYNWMLMEERLPQSREYLPYPQYWTKEGFGKGTICNSSIARNWFIVYTAHWNEWLWMSDGKLWYYKKYKLIMPYVAYEICINPKPIC